jgi:hypothetical protein
LLVGGPHNLDRGGSLVAVSVAHGRWEVNIGVLVVLVAAGINHLLADALKVNVRKEIVKLLALFLKLNKELLRVATRLCTRARSHMLLHAPPLFAELLQRLNEAEVLV